MIEELKFTKLWEALKYSEENPKEILTTINGEDYMWGGNRKCRASNQLDLLDLPITVKIEPIQESLWEEFEVHSSFEVQGITFLCVLNLDINDPIKTIKVKL